MKVTSKTSSLDMSKDMSEEVYVQYRACCGTKHIIEKKCTHKTQIQENF